MASLTSDLTTVSTSYSLNLGDSAAWLSGPCPDCGTSNLAIIGRTSDDKLVFLRCVTCRKGLVVNSGVVSPGATEVGAVVGLVPEVEAAWQEVRSTIGVGATTSAVMMCRKILFHVAVDNGLPAKNDKDRAPTFVEVVKHLDDARLVTPLMLPWLNHIKDVGNEANHELGTISHSSALEVAKFTEQLLVTVYEMPERMKSITGSAPLLPPETSGA